VATEQRVRQLSNRRQRRNLTVSFYSAITAQEGSRGVLAPSVLHAGLLQNANRFSNPIWVTSPKL